MPPAHENGLHRLLKRFLKVFAGWLAYLTALVTTSFAALAIVKLLPMYASQKELFSRLVSLTCLVAFALSSVFGVIFWYEKYLRRKNGTRVRPRSFFLKLAAGSLAAGFLALGAYLWVFDVSVRIETARFLCRQSADTSEFASATCAALAQPESDRLRIADRFLEQWRPFPPDLTDRVTESSVNATYGFWLLGLNVVTVVGFQNGLFLLALCNFFVARS